MGLRRTWWSVRLITRGLGFGLERCELPQGSVWSRGVEVVQVDRENLA
jgi:hypothetical protein